MKIAICGKGGCGKSTTTALLAKELARIGKRVLVIDSDESNYGLHRQLGMELPRDFTEYFGGKDKAFKRMMTSEMLEQAKLSAFAKKFFSENFTFADIPEEYCGKKDGVMLLSSGKIHRANEGCACTMNSIIEQFITNLQLSENEFALIDMEAGIEHFGRGVDNSVDLVLMIVDPSFESLRLSKKIQELGASIGKPVRCVLNKVTDDIRQTMVEAIADSEKIAAVLPADAQIAAAGLAGEELTNSCPGVQELARELAAGGLV